MLDKLNHTTIDADELDGLIAERDRLKEINGELLHALISLYERAKIYGGTKGGKMDLGQAQAAILKARGP